MLQIGGELQLELNGNSFSLHADDGLLIVNIADRSTARALLTTIGRRGGLYTLLSAIERLLVDSSHRLEVRTGRRVVIAMGAGVDSRLLRLAGFSHVRIWPTRMFRLF